jgi:hypothetical protein
MTHDERIEAMGLALYDHAVGPDFPPFDRLPAAVQLYWLRQATAALAAASMEAAVREAVDQACDGMLAAFASGRTGWLGGLTDDERDAIVSRVMGRE